MGSFYSNLIVAGQTNHHRARVIKIKTKMIFYCFILGLLIEVQGTPLGAPEFLSIDGHEDCLGKYSPSPVSTAVCLPSSRPDQCIPPAWTELQQKFNGENCPEEPVIGGIGGLPPAYLSIDGHEDCLGEYSPSPVSTAVCLPSTRPSDCQRRAWFQLKGKLENCPEEPPVIGGI